MRYTVPSLTRTHFRLLERSLHVVVGRILQGVTEYVFLLVAIVQHKIFHCPSFVVLSIERLPDVSPFLNAYSVVSVPYTL